MRQARHGVVSDPASRPTRLDHLYGKFGVGYLFVILSLVFVIACIFAAFDMAVLQLYRDVGLSDFGFLLGLGELVNVAGLLLGVALFGARPIWRLASWTRTGKDPDILDLIVNLPWRMAPPIALLIMIMEIPAIIYFSSQTGAEVPIVVVLVAILAPNATAAFFIYLILEYLLGPIARSAASSQEAASDALPRPAVSLRRKLMFGLPIVNFMTAYVSVGLAGSATSVTGRLSLGVAAALVVTLTVSLVLTTTLARSFNDPIDELVTATDRVAKGDLSTSVMAFAADEMGVLASRFNQMVVGLAERERIHQAFGTYVDKEVAASTSCATAPPLLARRSRSRWCSSTSGASPPIPNTRHRPKLLQQSTACLIVRYRSFTRTAATSISLLATACSLFSERHDVRTVHADQAFAAALEIEAGCP